MRLWEDALEGVDEELCVGSCPEVDVEGVQAVEIFGLVARVVGRETPVVGFLCGWASGGDGEGVNGDGYEVGVLVVIGDFDLIECYVWSVFAGIISE